MKRLSVLALLFALAALPAFASSPAASANSIVGDYVEARTAEVFTGGCIMGSEAETMGRQAILAWRIDHGSFNGVKLDGLAMTAAVAGNRNLGISEMGGTAPDKLKAALVIDARATAAQRDALIALAKSMTGKLLANVVDVKSAPVTFSRDAHSIYVSAEGAELAVSTHMHHDPSCGAMQWFHPFVTLDDATIGVTNTQVFSGPSLGVKWSDPDKRSAFFGTFSIPTPTTY